MATNSYLLTDTWQEIPEAGSAITDDFIAESVYSGTGIDLTFSATTPASNAAYFPLGYKDSFIRAGVVGKLYARNSAGYSDDAKLIVTGAS